MRKHLPAFLLIASLLAVYNLHPQNIPQMPQILDKNITLSSLKDIDFIPVPKPVIPDLITDKNLNYLDDVAAAEISILDTEKYLLEYNETSRHPLASLTKLMTAVIASENTNHDSQITLGADDIAAEGNNDSLRVGETFTAHDLIIAMLAISSNDAAQAIARSYGQENFINAMKEKANLLDMKNTSFFDSTGLSPLNQSTIYDLQKLVKYIWRVHPEIFAISREKKLMISELASGEKRELQNINRFAGREDFYGGKTGYTAEANGNLISLFHYKNHPVLVIILGTSDRFGKTEELYNFAQKMIQ